MLCGLAETEGWPEAVVFDLDGTVADTAMDIRDALNLALAAEQVAPIGIETVKTMIGAGPEVLVERALARRGACTARSTVLKLTTAFNENYDRCGNALSRLFEDVEPCLEALSAMNIRMGICSNKPEPFCEALLRDLGVLHYFPVVQGFGSGLPPKPDPRPLLEALSRLGVTRERALYVGDSETDVKTARAAGVPIALVSHGYTVSPVEELGGDWLLPTLAELPELCRQAQIA